MTLQNSIDAPYEIITHATTFTWGGHTTGSFNFKIVSIGKKVSIQMPFISITATQNAIIASNTAIPSRFRPSVDTWGLNFCLIGGNAAKCLLLTLTTGIIQFKTDGDVNINSTSFQIRPPSIEFIIQN